MQLLAEMDGFTLNTGVKIMAATNRPDILDPAILRPGRFDRIINFKLPESDGRLQILRIYTRKMPLGKNVRLQSIANMLDNMSGADIKSICTESGMNAIRANRDHIIQRDFIDAIQKQKKKSVGDDALAAPVYS